jgi:hypothetical protein
MPKNLQRPVAKIEQPIGPALVDRLSWDDLKLFMTVGHTLSSRKAATSFEAQSRTVRSLHATEGIHDKAKAC